MKPVAQWITIVLVIVSSIPWAWADGAGVIKGTITINGKPTSGAVVSIEGLPKDATEAQTAVTRPQKKIIDQQNLKFSPTVVAVRVGDTVEFPNHDKVWHNVYSKGGAAGAKSSRTPAFPGFYAMRIPTWKRSSW
jgi:plastocyanin